MDPVILEIAIPVLASLLIFYVAKQLIQGKIVSSETAEHISQAELERRIHEMDPSTFEKRWQSSRRESQGRQLGSGFGLGLGLMSLSLGKGGPESDTPVPRKPKNPRREDLVKEALDELEEQYPDPERWR